MGAGSEGWEGGGTDAWPHLNPLRTRRGQRETLHLDPLLRTLRAGMGERPACFLPLSSVVRPAAPKVAGCGDHTGLAPPVVVARGSALPGTSPASRGIAVLGDPFAGIPHPILAPLSQNSYPGSDYTKPSGRKAPPLQPPPVPLPPLAPLCSRLARAPSLSAGSRTPDPSARGDAGVGVTGSGNPSPACGALTPVFCVGCIPLLCSPGSLSATFSGFKLMGSTSSVTIRDFEFEAGSWRGERERKMKSCVPACVVGQTRWVLACPCGRWLPPTSLLLLFVRSGSRPCFGGVGDHGHLACEGCSQVVGILM